MQIVPTSLQYARSFCDCLGVVAREKRFLAQIDAPPLVKVETFIRDMVANDGIQFFAVEGQRVVGWADIISGWAHAIAHRGSLGIGVLAEYRGQGLGEKLLRACIAKARLKGITRVELESRADNEPAIRLYEKVGFQRETLKHKAMRYEGVYFDAVQMSLLLD
jgi:ribosomal protein S18 acetylase RimI-like enzyme